MTWRILVLALCLTVPLAGCAAWARGTDRPSIFLVPSGLPALRERAESARLQGLRKEVEQAARNRLQSGLVSLGRGGSDSPRRQLSARQALDIILLLGTAYLVTEDASFAEGAKKQVLSMLEWPSWVDPYSGGSANLMTASACAAVGVGYDWLYNYLTPGERDQIKRGLIEKGLQPYVNGVEKGEWWARVYNNWNAVVNGGCGIAAIALRGEDPVADRALGYAKDNIAIYFRSLKTEGGWDEGLAYWNYGTQYALMFADAVRSAIGSREFLDVPAVSRTGWFPIIFTAPDNMSVQFCDDGGGLVTSPAFSLLAREFKDAPMPSTVTFEAERSGAAGAPHPARGETSGPAFGWYRHLAPHLQPLDLIWDPGPLPDFDPSHLPRAALYSEIGWAMLRSRPGSPDDIYLAFKSGNLAANHGHLDLNSFVVVAFGERFAIDPGPAPYTREYFSPARWKIYQASSQAHNTVLVNGRGQAPRKKGTIARFETREGFDYLLGDAGDAYGEGLTRFDRHILFLPDGGRRRYFVVADDLEAASKSTFEWLLHTNAQVKAGPGHVELRGSKASLDIFIVEPQPFDFSSSVSPAGERVVRIANSNPARKVQFIVVLYPRKPDEPSPAVLAAETGLGVRVRLADGTSRTISFARSETGRLEPEVSQQP
jgi:hypothetical protein